MAEIRTESSPPPKRRRWGRAIGIVIAVLVLLLAIGYFVLTSEFFVQKIVLPRVSKTLNARVTATDTKISPFSHVSFRGLKVETTGSEPLATVQEARVNYSLGAILGGNIKVSEITVVSPVLQIITNPDGSSNLDPITKQQAKKPSEQPSKPAEKKPAPAQKKTEKPLQVDLGRLSIQGGVVRMVKIYNPARRDLTEISDFNLNVANVKNGGSGSADMSGKIRIDNNPPAPATNGQLAASLKGKFDFTFSKDLKPEVFKGGAQAAVENATGSLAELGGAAANIDSDVTPTKVKQLALKFQKNTASLGLIRASGPLDLAKQEGRLNVEILSIDRQVLNLIGASSGIDFGPTKINSTNVIELAKDGNQITASGTLDINQLSLTRTNQTTPPADIQLTYGVKADRAQQNATVQTFALSGVQNKKQFLSGQLTSPMNLSWGGTAQNIPDSALKLVINDFDFAAWKAFLGEIIPEGKLNATMNVASQNSGKLLTFELASQAEGVTAMVGSNQLTQVSLRVQSKGRGTDLKKFNLENYRLELARQGQALATVSGAGQYDKPTSTADMDVGLEANLAAIAKALPKSGAKISSGNLQAKTHITQKGQNQSVTGNLLLDQLNAAIGSNRLESFAVAVDLDVQKNGSKLDIRKADGNLRQANNAGGRFETKGSMNLDTKTVQLDFNLVDLNQNVLRPFLQQAMQGKQLVSATINARTSAKYDPEKDSTIKGNLQVNKLVVNDPEKRVPATPLELRLDLDTSIQNKRVDLRQCSLALTPTQRAKNQVQLKGDVDLSQTNAIQGKLTLFSQGLDATPYYDLFTSGKKAAAAATEEEPEPSPDEAPKAPPPNPPLPPEPPAKQLPFRNFVFDANIERFFLREVEITNLVTELKMHGGKISLNPMQLSLNGAPIKGNVDLDLGVPGYQYAFNLNADAVPLQPIANSFMPRYKDRAKGNFNGVVQIKGAGTTGINLQKTLAGQLDLSCTNSQIQLAGKKSKKWIKVVSSVLRLPELQTAPITAFNAQTLLGQGKINIKTIDFHSDAFTGHVEGSIPIAKVLTNSPIPNIPIQFALKRSLAEKGNLVPPETPADAQFVQLPNFLRVTGTLGDADVHTDKVVILSLLARSGAGRFIPGQGGKVLDALGNILPGGSRSTNHPATSTNNPAASTNTQPSNPVGNILDSILNKNKKPKDATK